MGLADELLSMIGHMEYRIPNQLRALRRIPIRRVLEAMKMDIYEVQHREFEHQQEVPWNKVRICVDELTNDWHFEVIDKGGDIFIPYDFESIKSTIDLVMFLEEFSFERAVMFLLEKFPEYRLPDEPEY